MKKIISDVINFPNDCETVRFTACFVSMLMRAEGITEKSQHSEIYNLYNAVSGYSFLQIDLSNDEHMREEWDMTCQKLLREFDYYVGFTMDYAGYEFDEVQAPETEEDIFAKVKDSIDRDIPVLMQLMKGYQWVLITGYDDNKAFYGFDGSQGYWGKSPAEPEGYEDGLFILPDWYEKLAHAFILGNKKNSGLTIDDVFRRGIQIMERMQEKSYFKNSISYMRNDENFNNLDNEQLLLMRSRISKWIGQPIDQRAVLGWCMNPLRKGKELDKKIVAYNAVHGLCWTTHDVLWIAWKALGEYMGGEPLDWANGLKSKIVRNAIADCFDIVCRHDEGILGNLKDAFLEWK